jgi:DNA-binding LacI/PurR family transcriptional regulator
LARGLVQKRTGTIGVVLPDVANPFCAEVLRGMGDVAYGLIYPSGMVTPSHRQSATSWRSER